VLEECAHAGAHLPPTNAAAAADGERNCQCAAENTFISPQQQQHQHQQMIVAIIVNCAAVNTLVQAGVAALKGELFGDDSSPTGTATCGCGAYSSSSPADLRQQLQSSITYALQAFHACKHQPYRAIVAQSTAAAAASLKVSDALAKSCSTLTGW
jgi:hypothetical protein